MQKEESKYYIDYERRTAVILKKKKIIIIIRRRRRTEQIKTLVKYCKNIETLLKKKKKKKENIRNDFIEILLKWINDLNIKNYQLLRNY